VPHVVVSDLGHVWWSSWPASATSSTPQAVPRTTASVGGCRRPNAAGLWPW